MERIVKTVLLCIKYFFLAVGFLLLLALVAFSNLLFSR